jgi:hypothetical protein
MANQKQAETASAKTDRERVAYTSGDVLTVS